MCFGKTGDRISQQQHVQALIAEMFGHRHRSPGTAAPDQGGLVRGRGDDDGAPHPFGPQDPLDKFAQFAAAFADQRDDDDIGGNPARELAKKGGFSDPGAGKKPDPLTAHHGQKRVKDRNAGLQAFAQTTARGRSRSRSQQGPHPWPLENNPPVQGVTKGIYHPADPAVVRRDPGLADQPDQRTHRQTLGHLIGQHGDGIGTQGHHLAAQFGTDHNPVAETGHILQPAHNHRAAPDLGHPAHPDFLCDRRDFRQQCIKNTRHGILPSFSRNPF